MIEYWQASDHEFPEQGVAFKYKMETDLFALAKARTHAGSLAVSNDGTQFAVFCADKWISPFSSRTHFALPEEWHCWSG